MPSFFDELKDRGYIYQCTHDDEAKALIDGPPMTFYLGIDPTADSLHIGHFFALMMFKRLQDKGHRGILLVGDATGMVGDPSGRSDMRRMMERRTMERNKAEVAALARRFIRFDGDNPAVMVFNGDWTNSYPYIDFMRDVGQHFNVAKMLSTEIYDKRLEEGGLTFMEMGYMLMQAYDFVHLNRERGCVMQIGGSDQWANIAAGSDLGRKMNFQAGQDRARMIGVTCPLLMNRDGTKMGKTAKGTLWVARDKTTPYDFYQYFYNTDDGNVEMLLKLFTDIGTAEIESMVRADIVAAKRRMAWETTALVHGAEEADGAVEAAKSLFGGAGDAGEVPTAKSALRGGKVVDVLVEAGFLPSKAEARRLIAQGGLAIDDEKVTDPETAVDSSRDSIVARKGKKSFLKILFE